MPLIIPSNSISAGGYVVDNSLRFNDGSTDYLTKSTVTPTDNTKGTFSCWFKRSKIGTSQTLFSGGTNIGVTSGTKDMRILISSSDYLEFYQDDYNVTGNNTMRFNNMALRDVSAWYHLVVAVDTGQASNTDKVKYYINGTQLTASYTSLGESFSNIFFNTASLYQHIGVYNYNTTQLFDGYMSETVFIDGQQLDPTSFGEFDEDSGIWKPIDVSGLTFGTNGFYLPFENSGTLGQDDSGNGNNFTVNNLTAIDQTTDTPTNNFATFNNILVMNSTASIAEGNLKATSPSNYASGASNSWFSTIGFTKGKWYAEFKPTTTPSAYCLLGIGFDLSNAQQGTATSQYNFAYSTFGFAYQGTGGVGNDSVGYSAIADTYTANDIIGIAVDVDNSKLYVSKNGVFQNSSNPSAGTGGYTITADKEYFFAFADNASANVFVVEANFGNAPYTISSGNTDGNGYGNFEYAVPSGYLSLCTKNLSEVLG